MLTFSFFSPPTHTLVSKYYLRTFKTEYRKKKRKNVRNKSQKYIIIQYIGDVEVPKYRDISPGVATRYSTNILYILHTNTLHIHTHIQYGKNLKKTSCMCASVSRRHA